MTQQNSKEVRLAASLGLLVVLVVAYSNHFDNGFYFDDTHTIVSNGHITSLRNLPSFFLDGRTSSSLPTNQAYRPVTTTLLAIDYWVGGGLTPFYFHLSQFSFYVVQLILMFVFFRATFNAFRPGTQNDWIALLGVAFYGLHAANAETINYIISRSDSFSTLCVIASFVLFQIPTTRRRHLYLFTMILGIYTKQTAVMFGPLLLLYVLLFEERLFDGGVFGRDSLSRVKRGMTTAAPALFFGFGLFLFNQLVMTPAATVSSNQTVSRIDYLMTQCHVIVHYLGNFVLPIRLSADPDIRLISQFSDPRVMLGILVVLALLVAAWFAARRHETRPITFGILWFFAALLPTSSVVPLYQMANDHRTFFPYVGLVMATTWFAAWLFTAMRDRFESRAPVWGVALLIGSILVGHALGTHRRNEVWGSDETLWHDVTLKSPGNGRGLMNYGLALMEQGRYEESLGYYERALALQPTYSYLHTNMGILKNAMGRGDEAEQHFLSAVRFGSSNPEVHLYYARWLRDEGRLDEAQKMLEKGLVYSPEHRKLKPELAAMRVRNERSAGERLETLARQTADSPTAENYLNLSLAYYRTGRYRESIKSCERALEIEPNLVVAYNNLCSAYVKLGEFEIAIEACTRALEIDPEFARARANLRWARAGLNAGSDPIAD